jgi:molybdopterin-guanine dinucleotide biosynthesis protein A
MFKKFPSCGLPLDNNLKEDKKQITAIILAGGKSSRMGKNKAMLKLGNKTLIETICDTVKPKVKNIIIITNTPQEYEFLNYPKFKDVRKKSCPLVGIYTGLLKSETFLNLVIACDLPFISSNFVEFLTENGTDHDVFAIEDEKGIEPLCAIYSKNCIPFIEKSLNDGEFRVTDFYKNVNAKIVKFESKENFYNSKIFFNVNTPEEFEKAVKILNMELKSR